MSSLSVATPVVFHSLATVAAPGIILTATKCTSLVVEVFGVAPTGATIQFFGCSLSGTFVAIQGTNLSTGVAATSIAVTTTPILFSFNITGLTSIKMNLSAITSGSVTVQGTVSL